SSLTDTTCARLIMTVSLTSAPTGSKGKKPVSAFSRSATRSGPTWPALDPARKNDPRTEAPVASVTSASARRFSTRNCDIPSSIGRKRRQLDILIRHGIHTDRKDLVQRQAGGMGRREGARSDARASVRNRRVRRDALLRDAGRAGRVPPRCTPRTDGQVGRVVRAEDSVFAGHARG